MCAKRRHPAGKRLPIFDTAWALDKALTIGAEQERQTIAAHIAKLAGEWQKPTSFNPRTFLFDLAQAVGNGEHLGGDK